MLVVVVRPVEEEAVVPVAVVPVAVQAAALQAVTQAAQTVRLMVDLHLEDSAQEPAPALPRQAKADLAPKEALQEVSLRRVLAEQ
jgi:hypothetical protein